MEKPVPFLLVLDLVSFLTLSPGAFPSSNYSVLHFLLFTKLRGFAPESIGET